LPTWLERRLGREQAHPDSDLSAFIDGALDAAAAAKVEAHLSQCAACRAEVDALRAVKASLQSLPAPRLRRSFTLSAADVAAMDERRRQGAFWWRGYAAGRLASAGVAALLLVVLGLDAFSSVASPSPAPSAGGRAADMQESAAPAGEQVAPVTQPTVMPANRIAPAPFVTAPAGQAQSPSAPAAQPAATLPATPRPSPDGRMAAEATAAGTPAGQAAGAPETDRATPETGPPPVRTLQIALGAALIALIGVTLYLRARARQDRALR
jgi:hypothetical protein